jgi:hydrogenase maturation protease
VRARVLVAGIGNIFLGDDGFGSAVAQALAGTAPPDVKVEDFGIRGVHLAYELVDGFETVILVDAVNRGDPPGTVSVIEPSLEGDGILSAIDAHGMDPEAVLQMVGDLGGSLGRVLVVGCEIASIEEGIGLSPAVSAAVPAAAGVVQELLTEALHPIKEAS